MKKLELDKFKVVLCSVVFAYFALILLGIYWTVPSLFWTKIGLMTLAFLGSSIFYFLPSEND